MQKKLNLIYKLARNTVKERAAIAAMTAEEVAELTIEMLGLLSKGIGAAAYEPDQEAEPAMKFTGTPVPAVPIEQSVHDDYIICLEDGQRFKMMRRHLAERYGMTPDQYRNRWGLPPEYPMTAPNYSKVKSNFARNNELGKYPRN